MLINPIELPQSLRAAASMQSFSVPRLAKCESFVARHGASAEGPMGRDALAAVLCTQPVLKDNERFALGALVGGSARDRRDLMEHFVQLQQINGLKLPDSRASSGDDHILLTVPWMYRGEIRAVLAQAAHTWSPIMHDTAAPRVPGGESRGEPTAMAHEARDSRPSRLGELPSVFASSIPEDSPQVDYKVFKRQLNEFGLAFDGAVSSLVRRLFVGTDARAWNFPFGCTVQEQRRGGAVVWTLSFVDIETLERAHVLLTPVLLDMARRGSRLRPDHASVADLGDDVVTEIPQLVISSSGNTESARVEMARLLWQLISTLDRTSAFGGEDERELVAG